MLEKGEILDKIINGVDGRTPLSPDQKKAVLSDSEHIRILAGAGAGKTETLTRRILYLLLYKDVDPSKIVAFTFTEKAAQSMKSRIYQRVTEIMGEEYAHQLGKMFVGTIHSYALRILQDHFGYGNYDVLDDKQEMAFVMRRAWEIGVDNLNGTTHIEKCKKFIDAVNVVYDELIPEEKLREKNPEFYKVFKKYEEVLNKYHRLTFGRLIYLAVSKLKEQPDKIPPIEHLIVDEYQDINHAQEELILALGRNASVLVVGDPRQTIYQWRGSDDQCFERFVSVYYEDAEAIVIPENRRSGKKIVEVGNKIADKLGNYSHMKSTKPYDGHVYVVTAENPTEEARWIVNQIKTLVEEKNLKYSDFGILLRSVQTSGGAFISELKRNGIPYIVGGTIGLFRREEATAVGKLFVWLYDGSSWRKGYRDKIPYDELLDSALEDWKIATGLISDEEIGDIKKELENWKKDVLSGKYRNFQEVYHALLLILRFKELDPNNKLDAAIMANLGRFSNLLGDYENAVRLGGVKLKFNESTLKGLMYYIQLYATTAYEEQLGEDIRGIDAVQITTIHQAKGLEWSVVFLPALVDRRFPSNHVDEKREWLISRDLFPADRYDLKESDERRLFYVAVTRAKETLVLSYFRRINNKTKISKFLEDVLMDNPTTLEVIDTSKDIEVNELSSGHVDNEISTFDAGEIVDYTKCPYFYRLRYLWNYDAPITEELGYGNALHYCLRKAVELHKEGYNPLSAIVKAMEDFHLPYAPPAKIGKMKEGAKNMLLRYAAENLDDINSVAEVEYRLEFPQKNATITGKVDVIIDRGDEVEVREYKTSRKVIKPEQVALQVRLYALGLRGLGYKVGKGSVAYLGEGEIDPVCVDEKSLDMAKRYAEQILDNLEQQKYDPTPGEFCENCDYKAICKWYKKPGGA